MRSPIEVGEAMSNLGVSRSRQPFGRMFSLAILAGFFLALAGVGATAAGCTVDNASTGKLISALVFPAGLAMIIISGSELFTGNCLIIIPVLQKKLRFTEMLRNWISVFIGNFIGALLVCVILVCGHTFSMYDGRLAATVIDTAVTKCSISFGDAVLRGILCNVLVCLGVWMAAFSDTSEGKIISLIFPIFLFVVVGYEHCIANMYYVPAGLLAAMNPDWAALATKDLSMLTWSNFLLNNLLPVTIGNIIGGAVFIGSGYVFINSHD